MKQSKGTYMTTALRPRIALTLGDPAGVGPELVARQLADPATSAAAALAQVRPVSVSGGGTRA